MTVQVAVAGHPPMYTRGLAACLADHGHRADVPTDLLGWARRPGPLVVFLALTHEDDWAVLRSLVAQRADAAVVGVIAEPGIRDVTRAVIAGAVGVMPLDAEPATVGEILHAALRGDSVVPVRVLRALAAGLTGTGRPVTEAEVGWLRELAAGTTVARLAERAGYSERMMFRLLADVYSRLKVSTRTGALMRAREEGWL